MDTCCLAHLWAAEHLAEGPHQRAVHAHELLLVHLVALVEHHPDLIIVTLQRADNLPSPIMTRLNALQLLQRDSEAQATRLQAELQAV